MGHRSKSRERYRHDERRWINEDRGGNHRRRSLDKVRRDRRSYSPRRRDHSPRRSRSLEYRGYRRPGADGRGHTHNYRSIERENVRERKSDRYRRNSSREVYDRRADGRHAYDDNSRRFRSASISRSPSPKAAPLEINGQDEESLMLKLMGFGQFDTTKNKEHTDADYSGINRKSKRKYRQYMNRKGGFNRPLSPTF